jgi:pyruvate/2-oxoglutarate/acetoin dehydrogenase E1 component
MSAITLLEAIRQGLWEEMERDERVFLLGEDIGVYGGAFKVTEGFVGRFGEERVIDTPISESAIVGAACGAAMEHYQADLAQQVHEKDAAVRERFSSGD